MEKKKRLAGLEKRWLVNNVSIMIALAVICVAAVTASHGVHYYYSNLRSGLEAKAKTHDGFLCELHQPELQRILPVLHQIRADLRGQGSAGAAVHLGTNGEHCRLVLRPVGRAGADDAGHRRRDQTQQHRPSYQGRGPARPGSSIMAVSSADDLIRTARSVGVSALRDVAGRRTSRSVMIRYYRSQSGVVILLRSCCIIKHAFSSASILEPVQQIDSDGASGSHGRLLRRANPERTMTTRSASWRRRSTTCRPRSAQAEKTQVGVHFLRLPRAAHAADGDLTAGARRCWRHRAILGRALRGECVIILARGAAPDRHGRGAAGLLRGCRTAALRWMSRPVDHPGGI